MHESVIVKFQADGNPCNLELGFVPDFAEIYNLNATFGSPFKIEWSPLFGEGKEIWHNRIADNTTTGASSIYYKASGGYISAYQGLAYDPGTENDDSDPAGARGFSGITIAAGFMSDDDAILVRAHRSLRLEDLGDIG
ncbi:hypothetical protein SAMN02745216_04900 [Desulfatibacillum alkenivorans DSM 16219]|jgi:hypothetical protein|uniref:Uncharacterized protein n=1 Tax=Desulfatibacillum alkenivorans DSM 16219 TaxID=1121393 RepID=A0A1M6Z4W7_9BACT|nr:hypothetical protein [Desulfatibacillum alkenivorans]SHL25443.1 hypothetical protein SAMN02745216_04900 [Desulfatibacillum alkenivorans DSM 16219]